MTITQSFGPLFDVTANRHRGNLNSRLAFKRQVEPRLNESHADLLAWLESVDQGTCEQYADFKGGQVNQFSGRFSELLRDGKIERCGKGQTSHGNTCAIYRRVK